MTLDHFPTLREHALALLLAATLVVAAGVVMHRGGDSATTAAYEARMDSLATAAEAQRGRADSAARVADSLGRSYARQAIDLRVHAARADSFNSLPSQRASVAAIDTAPGLAALTISPAPAPGDTGSPRAFVVDTSVARFVVGLQSRADSTAADYAAFRAQALATLAAGDSTVVAKDAVIAAVRGRLATAAAMAQASRAQLTAERTGRRWHDAKLVAVTAGVTTLSVALLRGLVSR